MGFLKFSLLLPFGAALPSGSVSEVSPYGVSAISFPFPCLPSFSSVQLWPQHCLAMYLLPLCASPGLSRKDEGYNQGRVPWAAGNPIALCPFQRVDFGLLLHVASMAASQTERRAARGAWGLVALCRTCIGHPPGCAGCSWLHSGLRRVVVISRLPGLTAALSLAVCLCGKLAPVGSAMDSLSLVPLCAEAALGPGAVNGLQCVQRGGAFLRSEM